MGNNIEGGQERLAEQPARVVVPRNGLVTIDGVVYRYVDGERYKVRTGEEMAKEMSQAQSDYEDRIMPEGSIFKSPFSRALRGAERHTRITPRSSNE